MVNKIIGVSGKDLTVEIEDKSPLFKEIDVQFLNASKIRAIGWDPKVSLDEGLKRTYKYYSQNAHRFC